MGAAEQNPYGSGGVGAVLFSGAQVEGHRGVDADGESHGNRVDQILDRKYQGQRRHGSLADLCHKVAVDNVVKRTH